MDTCFRCDKPMKDCKCDSWTVQIPFKVTAYHIDCIMDSAMYGCNYWCEYAELIPAFIPGTGLCFSEMLTRGHNMLFVDDEGGKHILTVEKMLKGIAWFISTRGIDAFENHDAGDADCIVQYALFGELVYG